MDAIVHAADSQDRLLHSAIAASYSAGDFPLGRQRHACPSTGTQFGPMQFGGAIEGCHARRDRPWNLSSRSHVPVSRYRIKMARLFTTIESCLPLILVSWHI